MPPVLNSPCSIDLWQFRSHKAISLSPTQADMMARFDADVPLVTVYERCAPKTLAAKRSLSPTGPLWPSIEPSAPRSMPMSVRNRFSPKKSKNTRPTGDFRNRDAALVARRRPRILALAVIAGQGCRIRRQQVRQVALDRGLDAAADERRRVFEYPDELVGQGCDFDADRARDVAAGHQEDRQLGIALADGAQQVGCLRAGGLVALAVSPVQQDAVDAGIGDCVRHAVLVRDGLYDPDASRLQFIDQRPLAARRGARGAGQSAVHDQDLAGQAVSLHSVASSRLPDVRICSGCARLLRVPPA